MRYGREVFKEDSYPTPELVEKYKKLVYETKEWLEKTYNIKVRINEEIIESVIYRWKKQGRPYCPCKPRASEYTICPCIDIPVVLLKRGKCTCGLFEIVR